MSYAGERTSDRKTHLRPRVWLQELLERVEVLQQIVVLQRTRQVRLYTIAVSEKNVDNKRRTMNVFCDLCLRYGTMTFAKNFGSFLSSKGCREQGFSFCCSYSRYRDRKKLSSTRWKKAHIAHARIWHGERDAPWQQNLSTLTHAFLGTVLSKKKKNSASIHTRPQRLPALVSVF